jgi:hypothetical protein
VGIDFWTWVPQLQLFLWLILLVVFAYLIVRAGSFAYFRTKMEYLRQMLKEMRREENGES